MLGFDAKALALEIPDQTARDILGADNYKKAGLAELVKYNLGMHSAYVQMTLKSSKEKRFCPDLTYLWSYKSSNWINVA